MHVKMIGETRIRYVSGGGCFAAFGLAFLLFMIAVFALIGYMTGGDIELDGLTLCFLVLFIAFPVALIIGRFNVDVDIGGGVYRRWFSCGFRKSWGSGRLDQFDHVSFTRRVQHHVRGGGAPGYAVYLDGPNATVRVYESSDAIRARSEAERLARRLGWRLVDFSAGTEISREPSELDEALAQRRRRFGSSAEPRPHRPAKLQSRLRRKGEGLVVRIPRAGLLGFVVGGHICVEACPAGLRLGPRWLGLREPQSIPANELEDLLVGRPAKRGPGVRAIIARSDAMRLEFGYGLSREEQEYLVAVIERALCRPAEPT